MKIGILLRSGNRSLKAALEEAACLGAAGVQLYVRNPGCNLLEKNSGERKQLLRDCHNLKLALPALCGELGGHGFQVAEENPEKITITRQMIELAEELEVPVISTHIGVVPANPATETYRIMLEAVGTLGEYAKAHGITLAVETGPEPPMVLRDFIRRTRGGVGVNFDPANLVMVQNCDAIEALDLLSPYLVHTHAKDGIHCRSCDPIKVYHAFAIGGFKQLEAETGELFREVALGEGGVRFPTYLRKLAALGYDGFLTIEREGSIDDISGALKQAVSYLKKTLRELSNPIATKEDNHEKI